MHDNLRHHVTSSGDSIAYRATEGKSPGVIFLGGFRSDMQGQKALALEAACKARGQAFLRFDYYAHGESDGDFHQGSIGRWRDNALSLLDELTHGPQLLIGSSMGGWIALLVALARRERIAALIGIAAAPDFTERLMWHGMTPSQQQTIQREGVLPIPSAYGDPYPITRLLIEEGRQHLLLDQSHLTLDCPVRLLQGMRDEDVPWHYPFDLISRLSSRDVQVVFAPTGDHRLSTTPDLMLLSDTLDDLLDRIAAA